MKFKTLKQKVKFKAEPDELYAVLLSSKAHSRLTGNKAKISSKVGGKFSAYDGWIQGKNLKLVKNKKIVQSWKGNDEEWPKNHFSKVTFLFKKAKDGTILNFTHSGIPLDWFNDIKKGWAEYYWNPLKKYLKKK